MAARWRLLCGAERRGDAGRRESRSAEAGTAEVRGAELVRCRRAISPASVLACSGGTSWPGSCLAYLLWILPPSGARAAACVSTLPTKKHCPLSYKRLCLK
ncbi:MAG: hypothetical protein PHO01_11085 [Desulfotomaculaceae bacterium]|nr:hypothetical protein [Desulfotomaculaceae bacterium]